ncbi:MAG TPA: sigma 54-interacting transcriptional regulator [Vicinamibacterales bacterium]|nr:sigma 54-interacting transcriptional regulator [Vicinamibacterales bacterium]
MQLVADRFVVQDEGGVVVDLASGLRVQLRIAPAGTPEEQLIWSAACDLFHRLHHRAIAPLLDYGLIGRDERFEAWQCGPSWAGAESAALQARREVAEFLQQIGALSSGATFAVQTRIAGPVIIPSTVTPPATIGGGTASLPIACRGLRSVQRRSTPALSELFEPWTGGRIHAAALWGPRGAGKSCIVRELARVARLRGCVPVTARFVDTAYRELWRGRNLFVIEDESGRGCAALLHTVGELAIPHVLLIVGESEVAGVHGVSLAPLPTQALVDAVLPASMDAAVERIVVRAAEQSRGWPGRFARLLWPSIAEQRSDGTGRRRLSRVAEHAPVYGGGEHVEPPAAVSSPSTWPAPGELASLRRRVADARTDLDRGRHASAIRELRQAIGGLSRRDAWIDAIDASLMLARALLRRGQAREARSALDDARQWALRSRSEPALLDVTILTGEACIVAARFDEAETVLAAAVTSAAASDDRLRHAEASVTLATCLFWRDRADEALATLDRLSPDAALAVRQRAVRWRSRIASSTGDTAVSLQAITSLLDESADATPEVRAEVEETAAWVRLAAGDLAGAMANAERAIVAARAAHEPLTALAARILYVEAERRRLRSATVALDRLRQRPGLPALLKRYVDAVKRLGSGRADRALEPLVDEVVAIVRACQTADEEQSVLKDVCVRVRQNLHAAAVAFVVGGQGRFDTIAIDGGRAELHAPDRAITSGIVIHAQRLDDGIEAAAPVQYGGSTIGALCVRWTLGSTYDHSRAAAVIATSAAAAAPIVSAALARRARVAVTAPQIIGTTAAIIELRRHVDRAASAPFPVLIQGESGSGKELIAQAIHRGSLRRDRPFRTLNCAAIPDDLADAELFGHTRGAFTGAVGDRTGVFEDASTGTLFLDEIGELSARSQAKLLRVIQEGEIRRVGENLSRRVDVRIVSATNRDLHEDARHDRFRSDLLYRLDVIRIAVPPLRERSEDIPLLVDHYWREATGRIQSHATLSAATVAALSQYAWPGNVRELQNVLASLAVRCPRRGVVQPSALPPQFGAAKDAESWSLDQARRSFEERFIRAALVRSGGHRGRAAVELGVTRQGLTKLMTRLGIS